MDNLNEYVLSVQNYKNGNYEYETITSPDEIKKAIDSGKKVVFIWSSLLLSIVVGLILIILGLIIGTLFSVFNPLVDWLFIVFPILFGALGLYAIIDGLLHLRRPFIVLGTEGIVYKTRTGDIKGFNWEDINAYFFEFLANYPARTLRYNRKVNKGKYICQVHLSFPNGDYIKVGNSDPPAYNARFYSSKEFPNVKMVLHGFEYYSFFLIFNAYYNFGKNGTFKMSYLNIDNRFRYSKPY